MMLSLVLLLRSCPKVLRRSPQNRRNRTVLADEGILVIYFFVPVSFFFWSQIDMMVLYDMI